LISYAVDLGTRVTTQFDSSREVVREIHVNRGMLTTRVAIDETKTYTIRNVDGNLKTLIIEQVQRPGYKLLGQKPMETTTNAYRFEVKLGAGGTEKFPVAEERVYDTTMAVSNLTPDVLLTYVQNKALSDTGRRQLQQIASLERQIAGFDNQIRQLDGNADTIVSDQNRVRQNIQSLNQVSGQQDQVQKYAPPVGHSGKRSGGTARPVERSQKAESRARVQSECLIETLDF